MRIIVVIISFFSVVSIAAQGNLQFNQAKLVSTVQTVPAGKVWKVESIQYQGGPAFYLNTQGIRSIEGTLSFQINGVVIYPSLHYMATNGAVPFQSFPIWLPAGSTLAAGSGTAFLSVIEFNIVP
jgi:hypothetical protein